MISNQLLKVWFDDWGKLRASCYVGDYRSQFVDQLPNYLRIAGDWTGDCSRWACSVDPSLVKGDYPCCQLYFILVCALSRAVELTDSEVY